jgi:hypothetical protein
MNTEEVGGHCPACLAEYRPGFEICADDGTPLVHGPAPVTPEASPTGQFPPGPPPRWTRVAELHNPDSARLLCGRLQAEGIDARIFPEEFSSYYGRGILLEQPVQVLVPEEWVREAQKVIRSIET